LHRLCFNAVSWKPADDCLGSKPCENYQKPLLALLVISITSRCYGGITNLASRQLFTSLYGRATPGATNLVPSGRSRMPRRLCLERWSAAADIAAGYDPLLQEHSRCAPADVPLAFIYVDQARVNGGSLLANLRVQPPNGPTSSGSCDVFRNGGVNIQYR
jgi:hypothetical protein